MRHIIQTVLMIFFVITHCFSFDFTYIQHTTTTQYTTHEESHVLSPIVGEDGYFASQNLAGFEAGDQFTQYAWDWPIFTHEGSARLHGYGDIDPDQYFLKQTFVKGYLHFLLNYAGLNPYNAFFYGEKSGTCLSRPLIRDGFLRECDFNKKASMALKVLITDMEESEKFQNYFRKYPLLSDGDKKSTVLMTVHCAVEALKKNQAFLEMGVAFHRAKVRLEKLNKESPQNDEKIFSYASYQTTVSLILLNWVHCVFLKTKQIGPNISNNFFETYVPEFLNPGEKYAAFLHVGHDILPDAENLPQVL